MKVLLITSYYKDTNAIRQEELDFCINQNIENTEIHQIVLLMESEIHLPFNSPKIKPINLKRRPLFQDAFDLANTLNPAGINILCNTDIFFDEASIQTIKKINLDYQLLALSRWDIDRRGKTRHFGESNSQDSWVWKGKLKNITNCNYPFGMLGCDNKTAYHFLFAGYHVINPSRQIKSFHLHNSGIRNYKRGAENSVPPPYYYVPVSNASLPEKKGNSTSEISLQSTEFYPEKVLHIALNYNNQKQSAQHQALSKLGKTYIEFDWIHEVNQKGLLHAQRRLIELSNDFKPDFTFMQVQEGRIINPDIAQRLHGFVMNWSGMVRNSLSNWYCQIGKHVDITCFSNINDVNKLRASGCKAEYLQIGFDPQIYQPRTEKKEVPDIVFMGNHYPDAFPLSGIRMDIVEFLKKRYGNRFAVYGQKWGNGSIDLNNLPNEEAIVYSNCKIAINCSHFNYRRYCTDRIFRAMGSGAFCITKGYPEVEKDFTDGEHLSVFHSLAELGDLIDYYLDHPIERQKIQEAGTRMVHQNHTWGARMKEIKRICKHYAPK